MRTLQRCASCGFEIGEEGHACRPAPQLTPEQRRAARQVAGLALPTRSVHELPHADSRRERPPARSSRRPSWASDFVAFGTMLALTSLLAYGLEYAAGVDQFVAKVPDGTAEVLGRVSVILISAAVVMILLAVAAGTGRAISRWRHRERSYPMIPASR